MELFSRAKGALHTMRHEHFGIAVVELMNAGIVTVAHKSAGPEQDIIGASVKPVGFLADTVDQYAFFLREALRDFDKPKIRALRAEAREWCQRFGPDAFCQKFKSHIADLM